MQTPTRLMSYEEYLALPYLGVRTEFIDGKVVELNPPSPNHNDIIEELHFYFRQYFTGTQYLSKREVQIEIPQPGKKSRGREPDLIVCTRQQWSGLKESRKSSFRIGNPPLAAIEVLSPGNQQTDLNNKQAEYARAEVPEYWRINPMEQWVEVLQLGEARMYDVKRFTGSDRIISATLPDLPLTAAEILDV